jgi:PmbA protein
VSDLLALAEGLMAWGRPGEQVEVYVARSRTTTVRAYGGEVESLTQASPAGVGVRVVVDGRLGFASAGTLEPSILEETLVEARDNAAFAAPDEANGLPGPDGVAAADLDLVRAGLGSTATEAKVDLALGLERATLDGDPRIRGVRVAVYGDAQSEAALASTTGVRARRASTSCHLSVAALAGDGDATQTGYAVVAGREPAELDLEATASEAVVRSTRMLGARQPASRRVTAVLEPAVAAAFLGVVGATLSGESVLKGRSPFADRVGEPVAAEELTLVEDPTEPASLGAGPYDGEGLACRRTVLLDEGTLRGFLHNTWSGRRSGSASTASAVRGYASTPGVGAAALALRPGPLAPDALLRTVGDGVLVQEVTGLHSGVNSVSGDFSVGAEGLVIRDGTPAEPFREATLASTLQRMLLDVVAVGSDLEWRPSGTGAVSLAIADVALAGR